jgi:hypothetical protein
VSDYHASQSHVFAAEQAIAVGDPWTAVLEFRKAAELQREFAVSLPHDRPVTSAVFGRSAAALEWKAHCVAESIALVEGPPGGGMAAAFMWNGVQRPVAHDALCRVLEDALVGGQAR